MCIDLIRSELQQSAEVLNRFMSDDRHLNTVKQAASLLVSAFRAGKKVISCGNGGSHCDAMHFAEELTGRYRENRPGYPAIAISNVSHISCVANDFGYEQVFSRYVDAIGGEGDVLFALSTSGHSANIIKAIESARQKKMHVIVLTGQTGGAMSNLADVKICVPHQGYADRIQEIHIKIIHILILLIEKQMKKNNGSPVFLKEKNDV